MRKDIPRREVAWTAEGRVLYALGCGKALERLRARLERGYPHALKSPRALSLWRRLAERSMHLIHLMAAVDPAAGEQFCDSELGAWYASLNWPMDVQTAEALAGIEERGLMIDTEEAS